MSICDALHKGHGLHSTRIIKKTTKNKTKNCWTVEGARFDSMFALALSHKNESLYNSSYINLLNNRPRKSVG